ncbi:LacI family DNA-binding transcriptional regulator [Lacisediminihabitans sp.]|uniref:LacI family DNA-binding transcriptional regulator n=1 Tax=Lacisediminihabitans sp. TaxID=2787631 RepID=UPI00374CC08D
MVKLSDVAALAGVSPAAVSRVLSGDTTLRVSAGTRQRVMDAAQQLDYVPNHAARSLRTSRTSTIALVVPDVTSAVFAELARGAEHEAAPRGLAIVLARAERLQDDRDWLRRLVGEGRIDGVILQLPDGTPPADLDSLVVQDTPIVVINSVDDGPLSTIVLDDAAGIRLAVEHLRHLGHTRIGLVGGLAGSATGARREAAFRVAMADAGLPTEEAWMTRLGYAGTDGRAAAVRLLESPTLPTALVVANLNAALGVLAEIHDRDLRVPGDISIVAMHDVWYADATWPPITTVKMPLSDLGAAAVTALADSDSGVTHTVLASPAPQLVVRRSTAAPRAGG